MRRTALRGRSDKKKRTTGRAALDAQFRELRGEEPLDTGTGRRVEIIGVISLAGPLELSPPAFPKLRKLKAPTWLRAVRFFACYFCGEGSGWQAAAITGRVQAEAHHYPGRGRSGGGSDLETCAACHQCHEKITAGKLDPRGDRQAQAVQWTQGAILGMVREGVLPIDFLARVGAEVAAS